MSQPTSQHGEITAVVLTLNEAEHIEACLASLAWADRRLVFDSFSDDETVALARAAGAEVAQSAFSHYAQQRNAALDYLTTDWVFFVDADERATPALAEEIRQVVAGRGERGWYVPRHNYIFGRLTKGAGWYPDYQLRLFRHGRVRYERPVHEVAVVDGDTGYLTQPLVHHNYQTVAQFHATQQRYTRYETSILRAEGHSTRPWTPWSMAWRQWWWRYGTLGGYRLGGHGLRLSLYMAYYEWLKYRGLRRGDEA